MGRTGEALRPSGVTGAQMCELIAAYWRTLESPPAWWDGTPESIWNRSPTGELWHVAAWFQHARWAADELARALAL